MAKDCKCNGRGLPALPRPGDVTRPEGYGDAMFGLGQSGGWHPMQSTSWFGSVTRRDTRPMPAEVILPVVMGFNPVPLETPRYDYGSYWREEDW